MQLFAPKDTTKLNLIFSGSPVPAGLAKVMQDKLPWKSAAVKTLLLPSPITDITPLPDQLPPNALYRHLSSRSATGAVINGCWTGRLLARDGYVPLLQVMCLWYMCFCAEVFFFSVLTLYSPMEHSLGVKNVFPPLFPHVNAVFFLHSLSSCSVYPVVICMLCMYVCLSPITNESTTSPRQVRDKSESNYQRVHESET